MKTMILYSTITLGILPLAISAEETKSNFSWRDVTFQPRIYAGYADYKLNSGSFDFIPVSQTKTTKPIGFFQDPYDGDISNIHFSGFLGGVGGTIAYGRFFGDIYYQSTLNQESYSGQSTGPNPENYFNSGDGNAKHHDWAVSLGYMINDYWSIFAGYKSGKTTWDQQLQFNTRIETPLYIDTVNTQIGGDFEQNGPFLGLSYTYPIGPGTLAFKVAYAYLDGTENLTIDSINYKLSNSAEEEVEQHLAHKLDGKSNAFSFGLSWNQSLSNNLGFTISANYHRYMFDLSGGGNENSYTIVNGEKNPYPFTNITNGSITESLFTLTATLLYRF